MILVDSHCHFQFPAMGSYEQSKDILQAAINNNVKVMLNIATTDSGFEDAINFESTSPNILTALGYHPCYIKDLKKPILYYQELLESYLLKNNKIVGIGETGLDCYHDAESLNQQKDLLHMQMYLCQKHKLPVIIHTRNSFDDTIAILKQYPDVIGVIHCFSGDYKMAKQALDLGFYISFSGIVTYKKCIEIQEVASKINIQSMLIETDAPYLAPVPYRGKDNHPALVLHTAEYIANLRNTNLLEIANATTNNFFTLFNKSQNFIQIDSL